ncbi:serine/threonine-protein kinase [Halotia wernerae UHCC 0503]|nr:serine/threonine-protein kinase [Halotia wernerae UHCC 0503]
MAQLVNQVLHDRYRIQSLLGRQTGRRTFLATDLQTGLSVVIKLLLFGPDFTWDDLKLFEREVEVLKSLDHPAFPKYLDCFEVETELGRGFTLVQNYIEAKSLQDWVQSGRTFNEEELKAIAKELLKILNCLHSQKPPVVHRDIKPSNILLGNRSGHSLGQIYLIDFGSVQTVAHNGTRTIVGTYGYMPPEQFGGQTTPPSDFYALGATLIYLATGKHPSELPQKEMRILFENQINLNPAFINWLKWMTEPSLEQRLSSTQKALEVLDNPQTEINLVSRKPKGSKIKLIQERNFLKIIINGAPGLFFKCFLLSMFGIPTLLFGLFLLHAAFTYPQSLSIFKMILINISILGSGLLLTLPFIIACISRYTQIKIDQQYITISEVSGKLSSTLWRAQRVDISKLVYIPGYLRLIKGDDYEGLRPVDPKLIIWAGVKKYEIGGYCAGVSHHSLYWLCETEIDWLVEEISNALNMPITRVIK